MSGFAPSVPHSTTFDGDTLTMQIEQPERGDMMRFIPFVLALSEKPDNEEQVVIDLVEACGPLLTKYIKEFKGLKDVDGNALTIEDVVTKQYFFRLAVNLLMRLYQVATVGKTTGSPSSEPSSD